MIKVRIFFEDQNIKSFVIDNHAMPEDRDFRRDDILVGETWDMICNSVSVLSQSVLIGLDEVLKLNVIYEINDGYLKLDLKNLNSKDLESAQVLLKTFELSLESLIMSLNQTFGSKKREEYIILLKEEV